MKQGFLVNEAKSRMTPSSRFEWLGVTWDTQSARLPLSADKRKKMKKDLEIPVGESAGLPSVCLPD